MQEPRKILIIKPSALGDIIQAIPVLSSLRKNFPKAHISWMVRNEFADLIEDHPYLDEIILFDRKFLGKTWCNVDALKALIELVKKLRRGKYDIVFDLQGLFRTACLGWLSGSKRRFGMASAREFGHVFYTNKTVQYRTIHINTIPFGINVKKKISFFGKKRKKVTGSKPVTLKSIGQDDRT